MLYQQNISQKFQHMTQQHTKQTEIFHSSMDVWLFIFSLQLIIWDHEMKAIEQKNFFHIRQIKQHKIKFCNTSYKFQQQIPINHIQKKDLIIQQKEMRNISIFVLLILAPTLICTQSSYNYNDWVFNPNFCRAQKFDGWDAFSCECGGGSGDYQYQYTNLPPGWQFNNKKLYIPRNNIEPNRVYGCKLSVYDRKLNRYLRRSILFNYDKDYRFGDIYDADWDFDFDNRQVVENFINNRFRNGNYYFYKNWVDNNGRASVALGLNGIPAPTFAPNQVVGSTSFIANGQNFNSIQVGSTFIPSALPFVNNIRSDFNIISPQIVSGVNYNLNPYYERYPSDDECETAVNEGDCIRIRDYIRYVSQSKFECKSRASFLQKLQSRIQNRIASYRTDTQNLRQTIIANQAKIKQLRQKSQRRQNYDYGQVNQRIRKYRQQLLNYNRDRDDYELKCKGNRESILKHQQELEIIRSNTAGSRNAIDFEDRRMRQIDSRIIETEARLRQLRDQRQQSRRKRQYHQRIIDQSQRRIQQYNAKIISHQNYVNEYETKSKYYITNIDEINRKIQGCNKEIQGYKSNNYAYKSEQITKKIFELEQQISANTQKSERLTRIYTELEKYQNQFEQAISKHYFACYKYLPPKNDPKKRGHYSIQSAAFYKYLKDTFGQVPNQSIRARFTGILDVKRLSPLSVSWTKVYDIPSTVGYGSNMDKAQNNYLCTESDDKLKVYNAKIQRIDKNIIRAYGRNGEKFTIHLGGCTRMELISDKDLPQIGQQILFKGYQRNPFQVYAHHVTCYT